MRATHQDDPLRDEKSKAARRLQRAEALLEPRQPYAAGSPESPRPRLAPWQIRRVLAYIDANLGAPLRNGDLAAVARLSEFHFNCAFRNSLGDSPHRYVIRRRLERAQGLMLSTHRALGEIALECGMADQAHLTRLFRGAFGESPAAWRRARFEPRLARPDQ